MARTYLPRFIPIDVSGSVMAVTSSMPFPSGTSGFVVGGIDNGNIVRFLKVDQFGALIVTGSLQVNTGSVTVNVTSSGGGGSSQPNAPSATRNRVTMLTSSFIALTSNSSRAGAVLFNDSPSDALVSFGPTCGYDDGFTYYLPSYSTLEFPSPVYSGVVSALSTTQTGSLRVTEITY